MSRRSFAARVSVLAGIMLCLVLSPVAAQEPAFKRQEDVIYGRKYGTALTMDVFTPTSGANGAAVIWVVSGGYFSSKEMINPAVAQPLVAHGYTVFAVIPGSQPRYQIPEIIQDMNRSVRFIRHHAKDYGIDPDRIGVSGGSAGGHLSLMLGTNGANADEKAKDAVDRESSRVGAVACFFPPTDFLNWEAVGKERIHATDHQARFRPSFDHHQVFDEKINLWERITDDAKLREISRAMSPIYRISSETVPTLIIHGDKDNLVPLRQSESFIAKLKEAGVDCKLVVKPGAGHGWGADMIKDVNQFVEWFDGHLKKASASAAK